MNKFLELEYESCLGLVKYYEDRQHSLVAYATGISSAVISVLLALAKPPSETIAIFWPLASLLSLVTAIGLLLIFVMLVQARLYFIFPVRQVNSIRQYLLSNCAEGFAENQMYLTTSIPAFKLGNAHSLMLLLVALQVGLFFSISWAAIARNELDRGVHLLSFFVIGGLTAVVLFGAAASYLNRRGMLSADEAVHRRKT